jgi:hypothetical protein
MNYGFIVAIDFEFQISVYDLKFKLDWFLQFKEFH